MQVTSNIIKENITYLNENIQNLNIKYEDFFNRNGKCNFSAIVLEIYERITSDTTQHLLFNIPQKVPIQTVWGTKKMYTIKKVQEILRIFLNKDKIPITRICRPDNGLICETLVFLKKLVSAGMVIRKEFVEINKIVNERQELIESLKEEKKILEEELSKYNNGNSLYEVEKDLFHVLEEISKKEDIKEKLLMEVKRLDEEKEYLKNELDVARKKEIDLDKEHNQLLSLLRSTISDILINDIYVVQENKRLQSTLAVLEGQKRDIEEKIEKLMERFDSLNHLKKIIDTRNEDLKYLESIIESIKKIDILIDEECKNIEDNFKNFPILQNEPLDLLRRHKLNELNSIDVIKNVFIPKIHDCIEKASNMITSLNEINKEELFKKRYNNEINEYLNK